MKKLKAWWKGPHSLVLEVLISFVERMFSDPIKNRASYLAFSLLLAIIPLLLVFIQLGSLLFASPEMTLYQLIERLPDTVQPFVNGIIDVLSNSVSSATISIGVITALWLGSNGINEVLKGMNQSLGYHITVHPLILRGFSVLYTLVFIILIIGGLFLVVFHDVILHFIAEFLHIEWLMDYVLSATGALLTKWLPLLIFFLVMLIFYKTVPLLTDQRLRWREAAIGALFSTLLIVLTTLVYAFITNNLNKWSLYFGSLAGILSLLLWIQYICLILVGGAELIAAYHECKKNHKKPLPEPPHPPEESCF